MLIEHYSQIKDWRWPHFTPEEMASTGIHVVDSVVISRGDGSLLYNASLEELLDKLEAMRSRLGGAPLIINSAYRDPYHNTAVGSNERSAHRRSEAADISLNNHNREALYNAAKAVGFTGFGFYNTFLHVDISRPRWWGRRDLWLKS